MDSDLGKLFIGGISWETTEEKLSEHFGQYGEVLQAVIMRDKLTNRPRGFGFVAFADPLILDRVLADKHTIDNRTVEAKRALARDEQHSRLGNAAAAGMGRSGGSGMRTKKIFVGGLPSDLTEDAFRQYFEKYGMVTDTVVMYDAQTQRPRGFGFITFDTEDSVDKVLHKTFHELNGKLVEVKRALPKDASSGAGTGGRSTVGGGGYQSYGGSSGGNTASYDSRVPPPQSVAGAGGYPSYGSSSYGAAPGYGYAGQVSNNGGYGSSGGGSGGGGYGGPVGPYLNPNATYPSGGGAPWNSQAPAGYGAASWNTAAGAGGGSTRYGGHQGGYGYGAREGSYGGGYGRGENPAGGTQQQTAAGGGYMGVGSGDPSNGSSGYPASWRSDPSHGGGGYGAAQVTTGGYSSGGAQLRQGQQQ